MNTPRLNTTTHTETQPPQLIISSAPSNTFAKRDASVPPPLPTHQDGVTDFATLASEMEKVARKRANKNMLMGALWCIGGTLATITTYNAAASEGGTYVIAWGAIFFGGVQFLRGLFAR